jgi:hypothetical protein
MKKSLVVFSLFCLAVLGAVAVNAQKSSSFAGTWILDKSKSEMPPMMAEAIQSLTWTITQDDKQLTRDQKSERNQNAQGPDGGPGCGGPGGGRGMGRGMGMMGGGNALTVKLDGSETVTESQRGKTTAKAKLAADGTSVEITLVTTGSGPNGDFTTTATEHWELADGGKTLKVRRTQETRRGPMDISFTFTKQ